MSSDVCTVVGPDDREQTIRVMGHRVLARRCKAAGDDFLLDGPQKAVDIPEHLKVQHQQILDSLTDASSQTHNCSLCEVLAVGPDVGKARPKADRKRLGTGLPDATVPVRVGDFVLLPDGSSRGLMWRGVTGWEFDVMADECEMIAVIPQEEFDNGS